MYAWKSVEVPLGDTILYQTIASVLFFITDELSI